MNPTLSECLTMSDWTNRNLEMKFDLINYWDMVEQIADMLSTERQVAMYLHTSSRQYELAIRGIHVPKEESDNECNHLTLQTWFNEEKGDPSHLPNVIDIDITDEIENISREIYFIEVLTRGSIHYGEALWSTDFIKTLSRHVFWRIYRIDESDRLIQLFQLLKRLVRCWNRALRRKRDSITTTNATNLASSSDLVPPTLKSESDIESSPIIQTRYIRNNTYRYVPSFCQALHLSLTLYLAWRTFSQ